MKNEFFVFCLLIFVTIACRQETNYLHYQLAGAPRADGIILQARQVRSDVLVEDDVPVKIGTGRFEISDSPEFENASSSAGLISKTETLIAIAGA